jgi:Zn-dependent protease
MIATAIIALIAMAVHEYAHARVAFAMGDPTAKNMGKMTLDPRANINWVGFLMFVVVGFGPLGSVPINERRMYNGRWGMLAAVAAGPLSNLILAVIFAIPFWLGIARADFGGPRDILPTLNMVLTIGVYFNVLLFIFNLIPLFPLDGWTVVAKLLPENLAYTWTRYQRESMYLLFILIFASFAIPSFDVFGRLVGQPVNDLTLFLLRLR